MAFKAPKAENNKKVQAPALEPGTYPARLVSLMILGLQPQRPYKGEEKPPKVELMTTYELSDEFLLDEEGNEDETKPRWVSETLPFLPLEADRALSTQRYLALDPQKACEGDWLKLIGEAVNVTIVVNKGKGQHEGKVFENISGTSVIRPKDAAKLPELRNEPRIFDFYEPDVTLFQSLPEWLQTKIKGALDFPGSKLEEALKGAPADKPKEEPKPKAKEKPAQEPEEAPQDDDEIPW